MSADDRIMLQEIFDQERRKNAPLTSPDKYFEEFSAEQILKNRGFDLDPIALRSGVIGGGDDGGADSIYLFASRKLIPEDYDPKAYRDQQLAIELIIIQSKNKTTFGEKPIEKLKILTGDCLRLNADLTSVGKLYKQQLLDTIDRFHTIYKGAITQRPTISISYYYATFGDKSDKTNINPKIETQLDLLKQKAKEHWSIANVTAELVDAADLYKWYNQVVSKDLVLEATKTLNSSTRNLAYVCLVPLRNFYKFITNRHNGALITHIFEANVRDYQGEVEVNKEIGKTLRNNKDDEFWWLNNGVTIIASNAVASGDVVTVSDPLIVNGLQTAHEVYDYFASGDADKSTEPDPRTILVRVIRNIDPQSSDRIIKATNSQTRIPGTWLHATEEIHRRIEAYLRRSADLYYDRRKNYYRNRGIPVTKIVTIPYLAQGLAAILLQKPGDARARPTTVADRYYEEMFNDSNPLELYSRVAQSMKVVDAFFDQTDLDKTMRLNLIFHVATLATGIVIGSAKPTTEQIASIPIGELSDQLLQECAQIAATRYDALGGTDQVAKGPLFAQTIRDELVARFG